MMQPDFQLTVVLEEAVEGGYCAYIKEVPGINTQGDSLEEVKENILDALDLFFEVKLEMFREQLAA